MSFDQFLNLLDCNKYTPSDQRIIYFRARAAPTPGSGRRIFPARAKPTPGPGVFRPIPQHNLPQSTSGSAMRGCVRSLGGCTVGAPRRLSRCVKPHPPDIAGHPPCSRQCRGCGTWPSALIVGGAGPGGLLRPQCAWRAQLSRTCPIGFCTMFDFRLGCVFILFYTYNFAWACRF